MHASDQALAARMLKGETSAFEEFFADVFPRLYRFALVRLDRNAQAAEDVAQEALLQVLRKLGTYRGEAALFSWCCTFCRHEISDHWRRTARRPVASLEEDAPEIRAVLDSLAGLDFETPEHAALRREVVRQVHVTLDHLPVPYSAALRWKYIEGRSVVEIAQRLARSPKAAESLLTRARAAFRDGFSAFLTNDALIPGFGPST